MSSGRTEARGKSDRGPRGELPDREPPDGEGAPLRTGASDCASKLRVLADSTRLGVVAALLERPLCVHELMGLLGVEQSLLSHHLRVMRDAGIVEGVRRGRAVVYRLAPGTEVDAAAIDLGCCRLSFDALEPDPEPGAEEVVV